MDVGSSCNSATGHAGWSRSSIGFVPFNVPVTRSKVPIWRLLCRKMKKEKKKIFDYSSTVEFSYDPYTYAQNFDEGSIWEDPNELSHSFSARFAVPSRFFQKNIGGILMNDSIKKVVV